MERWLCKHAPLYLFQVNIFSLSYNSEALWSRWLLDCCIFLGYRYTTTVLSDLLKYKSASLISGSITVEWSARDALGSIRQAAAGVGTKLAAKRFHMHVKRSHSVFNCFATVLDCKCASRLKRHGTTSESNWLKNSDTFWLHDLCREVQRYINTMSSFEQLFPINPDLKREGLPNSLDST